MNKTIKKIVTVMASAALSITIFTGCNTTTSDKNEQGQIVISVGSWPDKEGASLDAMNARKARYEEENPDVVIEPDLWRFDLATFYAKAAGGQLPTVYNAYFTEASQIIEAGYAADLTETLKKRGYDGMFNQQILDLVSKDGKIYAVPTSSYTLGLAYNTKLFEAAGLMEADGTPKQPKDWFEVAEFAKKIKEATGKPGFVLPTAGRSGGWIFTPIAWSFGVDFMEKDENGKWKATFDTPEMVEALEWFKSLKWEYDVLPGNALLNIEEWYKTFAIGEGAMTVIGGDYSERVAKYGMTSDQVGIMAMPAGPERHVTLLGGTLFCIENGATEEQIDAGLRWIETDSYYKATENYKLTNEEKIKLKLENEQHVGIKSISPWSDKAESLIFLNDLIDKNGTDNPNHVRLYNEFVENCPAEIQPEEPVCAQELYAILDGCLQEVLTNENADCATLIKEAAEDFQVNYLDNLTF